MVQQSWAEHLNAFRQPIRPPTDPAECAQLFRPRFSATDAGKRNGSSMRNPADRLAAFPRVSLAHLPTPLEAMPRLSAHLGGPQLLVKRDDCTGLGLGGNKVRKLEYCLAPALADGADCVVCGGVVQSNVARQVAAACARLGLECHLGIMHGRVPGNRTGRRNERQHPARSPVRAVIHEIAWTEDRNVRLREIEAALRNAGRRPYSCRMVRPMRWALWAMLAWSSKCWTNAPPWGSPPVSSCTHPAAPAPRPASLPCWPPWTTRRVASASTWTRSLSGSPPT